jgi:uncharacterized protein (TIGR00369 family)
MKRENSTLSATANECFVCGRDNPHGMKAPFEIDRERHTACCRMILPRRFQGWQDVIHGGILATLLDEACAHACRTVGPLPVTAEISVKYKKPVPAESEIYVWGEVVQQRRRVLMAQARLEVAGQVYVEAQAKVLLLEGAE